MNLNNLVLIGDVHGLFYEYTQLIKNSKLQNTLQLGDMGVGFPNQKVLDLSDISGNHMWFRGNHDNPEVAINHPNNIGDYGILEGNFIKDRYNKLFYMAGAWSIDWSLRIHNVTWWEDEQLSEDQIIKALDLYEQTLPNIVVTHDCPTSILEVLHHHVIKSKTSSAFDIMLKIHKPSYWIFAHHHMSWKGMIDDVSYIALNELETLDIS
ncbi:MAG: metallophosphoesterase [Candidatus Nanoarchaeia archaeon]|jgi:hypothetical protein|nr:metallophosphoesterase [Candidatus Nanoarchaeia archaeon]